MNDPPPSSLAWLRIAAIAGGGWGLVGYALLWGHTPVVVHRPFVESIAGTLVLLPVRVTLWIIHGLEGAAGAPFDLSSNHWWIALAAAAVGGLIVTVLIWAIRWSARAGGGRGGPSGGEGVAEPAKGI